jgi:hypothetical protein
MDNPKLWPAIISAFFTGLFGAIGFIISALLPPDPFQSWMAIGAVGFSAWMCLVLLVATVLNLVRWWHEWDVQVIERKQEAQAITPLSRASERIRQLTPEQIAVIPRFLPPDEGGIVYAVQEGELSAFLWTDGGNVPWDFVETFLRQSSNMWLYAIGNTSDGTPERSQAQAFTNWLIQRGYAIPAVGPHPAGWKQGGRERAADFLHIRLRIGSGYIERDAEPEPLPVAQ